MPTVRSLLCVLVLLALTGPVGWAESGRSVQTVNLYSAERIIAQDASGDEQVAVLQDALTEVFGRVSGRLRLPDDAALEEALDSPQSLMNQFNLEGSELTVPDAIGNPKPTYRLAVEFSRSGVQDALTEAGLPIWTDRRPRLTLALAAPKDGRIELLRPESLQVPPELPDSDGSEDDEAEHERLLADTQRTARALGLPVFWPLLDLADLDVLTPDSIWLGDTEDLERLGERYQTPGVMAGYLGMDPTSDQWIGRWHFLFEDEQTQITLFGETAREVVQGGLAMVADRLADRYAVDFSQPDTRTRTVEIRSLDGFKDFSTVRRYLSELTGTESVSPLSMAEDRAGFQLETRAEDQTLAALMSLGGQFSRLELDGWDERDAWPADYRYQWEKALDHDE